MKKPKNLLVSGMSPWMGTAYLEYRHHKQEVGEGKPGIRRK